MLYRAVWERPLRQLAVDEGISDVALRKRLSKLEIPLPPRGYWAKDETKRELVPVPDLPPITRESSRYVYGYAIEAIDIKGVPDDDLTEGDDFKFLTKESVETIKKFCQKLTIESQLRSPTKWVKGLVKKLEQQRIKEREDREKHRYSYWRSPRHNQVVPFDVSEKNEKRVLRILDTLDKNLFKIEGSISEGTKYIDRNNKLDWRLVVGIPLCRYDLLISEAHGKLTLSFSKNRESRPIAVCADSDTHTVEEQLGNCIFELCRASGRRYGKRVLSNRQYERRQLVQDWNNKYKKASQTEADCKAALRELMDGYIEAQKYRSFADTLNAEIEKAAQSRDVTILQELLSWVLEYADEKDPFVAKQNEQSQLDIWSLAEQVKTNRAKREDLIKSRPSFSDKELGVGTIG